MTRDRKIALGLLGFALAFNLFFLRWQVTVAAPDLNDNVLHLTAAQRAVDALGQGQDVADNWLPGIDMGYPLFHHYQNLPLVFLALLHYVFGGAVSTVSLLHWVTYLLLSLFPLSVYWAMRKLEFDCVPAALAALVAPLLSTNYLYGFEYNSYVWIGNGTYTQLWGMVLLPPTLAYAYAAIRQGKGYLPAVVLLSLTLLSHLVLGYIAAVSAVLFVFLAWNGREIWRRLGRLLILGGFTAVATSYFFVPFLLDRGYLNRSVWELPEKYASYGYQFVLSNLVNGGLLDYGRLPVLIVLAAAGLGLCLWQRQEKHRLLVVTFVFWLLLYFGRPTWGVLLNALPMSRDMQFHRLIVGVQLPLIFIAGLGLWLVTRAFWSWRSAWMTLVAVVVTVLVLSPAYLERQHYFIVNSQWMKQTEAAYQAEKADLDALAQKLRSLPPGRVYAGLAARWGSGYKVGSVPMYAILQAQGFDMLGYLYHALSFNGDLQVWFDETAPLQYDLWNVRYVVAPVDHAFPDFVRPLAQFGRHELYVVDTSGYFDLVTSDVALTGDRYQWYLANVGWLGSGLPAAKVHPAEFFGKPPPGYADVYPMSNVPWATLEQSASLQLGRVISERVGSNSYSVNVKVDSVAYLMLKATYHPGWQARVDGNRVPVVMLAPSYMGVEVSPGLHSASFLYAPSAARLPLLGLGLAALALLGIAERRRHRLRGLSDWLAAVARFWEGVGSRLSRWRPGPDLPFLLGVLGFAVLAGLPLFQMRLTGGHDALEYPPRVVEFYQGLSHGQIFPRWAPDLDAGYGQPFFNFNPPLFYYLASLFHFAGLGYVAAMDVAILVLVVLAGFAMYFFAREFLGRGGALVASVAYLFAPYFLVDLYVRAALSEFSAFPFIPLALWGMYRFCRDTDRCFLAVGCVSVALLFLTSNPASLIASPLLVAYVVFMAVVGRSGKVLLKGAAVVGLGLMLSAFFWLPSLMEKDMVKTAVLLQGYLNYANHFVYPGQLLYSPWGFGLSLPGPQDGMSFGLGAVHLVLLAASVFVVVRVGKTHPQARAHLWFFWAVLVAGAFFTITFAAPFWDRLGLLQYLEFPWRILMLPALALSFVAGFVLLLTKGRRSYGLLLAALLLALFLVNFPHAQPEQFIDLNEADYTPQAIAQRGVEVTTAREYEPVWVKVRPEQPSQYKLSLVQGNAGIIDQKLSDTRYEFWIQANSASQLRVNTFYFPGWKLWVDGQERKIDYSNDYGLMDFQVGPGTHYAVVAFTDTPVRKAGNALSLAGIAVLLGLLLIAPRGWRTALSVPTKRAS